MLTAEERQSMTEDPKLPKKQQRRSSSKINIDDTVVRDSLDRARKSLDRSFDKIRAKGPSISDEALSQLIVRKQYNPHNTLSNLWLGSTFKLVFYRFRPWAFSVLHAVFLFLWTRERCPDGEVTCDDPIFPFRESFADFGLGLPEMGPVITMCLFVLTFYCNTCITLYRELYFTLTTISTRMKNLSLFLRVFEDDPKKRWAIIRSAICAETSSVDLFASRRGEKRHASGAERYGARFEWHLATHSLALAPFLPAHRVPPAAPFFSERVSSPPQVHAGGAPAPFLEDQPPSCRVAGPHRVGPRSPGHVPSTTPTLPPLYTSLSYSSHLSLESPSSLVWI